MSKKDNINKTSVFSVGAGYFKLSLWEDNFIILENHSGIADMKSECIKIYLNKRILGIFGENLAIQELDGATLKIKGKIFKIEYLT